MACASIMATAGCRSIAISGAAARSCSRGTRSWRDSRSAWSGCPGKPAFRIFTSTSGRTTNHRSIRSVGTKRSAACGPGEAPLWDRDVRKALDYHLPLLTNSGIAAKVPDKDDARKGWHRETALPAHSPSLTLWVDGYWFEQGDKVAFRLEGPDRRVVIDRAFEIGQRRQRWFSFASAPRPFGGWPQGTYRGEVRVQRAGRAIDNVIGSELRIN